jgi:hypothetical protein
MGALSGARALRLPVRLHGIQLGRAHDLLLDPIEWRALGFEVRCGDDAERFLPFSTARVIDDEIVVNSALMLLEDVEFYRTRARSLRSLLGTKIEVAGVDAGMLSDLELAGDGAATALLLDRDGRQRRVDPAGALTVASRRDAA